MTEKRAEKWSLVLKEFNKGRSDLYDLKRLKALRNRVIKKKREEVAINNLYY